MIETLLAFSLAAGVPGIVELRAQAARLSPTDITADLSALPPSERTALAALVRASERVDALFLEQVWGGNANLLLRLSQDSSPLGRARLHLFLVNKGPWNRLEGDAPFLPDVPAKPLAATFYPSDAKAEIQKVIEGAGGELKRQVTSFYTLARRDPAGALVWLPYSEAYAPELSLMAKDLQDAARATQNASLRTFLEGRAQALLTNDYRPSEVAWLALDSAVEPTFGPYEVYEDGWFNLKAAFESFITVVDAAESQKLVRLGGELQGLEDSLPIAAAYRNPKLGAAAPIKVVDEIFAAGDANHCVQTAAYDLPNDETVTREKGTKRVLLKNVQEAKFHKVLLPIAQIVLTPAARRHVSFDAFFTHILMHELMHGLGPHETPPGGKRTVREALGADYGILEEAKADISGLWALQQLVDRGVLPKTLAATMYQTFLASAFRTLRFGLNEAHGKGQALQLNYLLDKGAFTVSAGCRFDVDAGKIGAAVRDLTHEIMTLQAEGDKAKAEALLGKLGVIRPATKCALDKLSRIPIDIEPRFVTASALLAGKAGQP
ncbi:MAG: dipeptidyl-peptidase 3 family protein [Myxococcales bacterium]